MNLLINVTVMNWCCLENVLLFVKGLTFVSFMLLANWWALCVLLMITDEGANGYMAHQSFNGSTDIGNVTDEGICTCLFCFLSPLSMTHNFVLIIYSETYKINITHKKNNSFVCEQNCYVPFVRICFAISVCWHTYGKPLITI